ncbi:MAG: hypothetical protein WKF70_05925 [Chitinophagaceae bacterium]
MNDDFQLPITYNGKEELLDARLLQYGYVHKFSIQINGQTVLFEPDEEGRYRAMIDYDQKDKLLVCEPRLLEAVVQALDNL